MIMEFNKQIGARIRDMRVKKGIKTIDFANFLGLTTSAVSLIENGKSGTSVEQLLKIAQFLDTSISYLIGEGEPIKNDTMLQALIKNLEIELERYRKREDMHLHLLGKHKSIRPAASFPKATYALLG